LRYLHFGLAAVLSFAAIKLVCGDALGPHPLVSVLVIASCIALAAGASFVSDHT
jgi:tellurite resistance protein TerC